MARFHAEFNDGLTGLFSNPFADAVAEKKARVEELKHSNYDKITRLETQIALYYEQIETAKAEAEEAEADYEHFAETGEIRDSLLPDYAHDIENRVRKDGPKKDYRPDTLDVQIRLEGTGWAVYRIRKDYQFDYITIKRKIPGQASTQDAVRARWCKQRDKFLSEYIHSGIEFPMVDYIGTFLKKDEPQIDKKFDRIEYVGERLSAESLEHIEAVHPDENKPPGLFD